MSVAQAAFAEGDGEAILDDGSAVLPGDADSAHDFKTHRTRGSVVFWRHQWHVTPSSES